MCRGCVIQSDRWFTCYISKNSQMWVKKSIYHKAEPDSLSTLSTHPRSHEICKLQRRCTETRPETKRCAWTTCDSTWWTLSKSTRPTFHPRSAHSSWTCWVLRNASTQSHRHVALECAERTGCCWREDSVDVRWTLRCMAELVWKLQPVNFVRR